MSSARNDRAKDNFALVRLIMAALVFVAHFKVLTGGTLIEWIPMAGDWRVSSFFVVSGYVIAASYERSPHPLRFYCKRFFRIYPLYALMIFIQAAGMSLFFANDLAAQLPSIARYLAANLVMLNFLAHDIGGLLRDAPNPGINASLWTLKVEAMFYAVMPLLFLLWRRFGVWPLVVLFVGSEIYAEYMLHLGKEPLSRQLPGVLRFIVAGMALYHYRDKFRISARTATVVCLIGLPLMQFRDFHLPSWLLPFLTAPLIIMLATKVPVLWQPRVDLSYGLYLMHAPLIQFALLTGVFRDSYIFMAGLALVTAGLAYVGYRFIEVPGQAVGRKVLRWLDSRGTPLPQTSERGSDG